MEVNLYLAVAAACFGTLVAIMVWQIAANPDQAATEFRQLQQVIFQRRSAAEWLAFLKDRVKRQPQSKPKARFLGWAIIAGIILFWVVAFRVLGSFQ